MRLSDIDLRLLRVFKAVADSGGFVKAQGVLGINQPAISTHIANLEQRLGIRLCDRGPQGFSLTQDGFKVLSEIDQLLEYLENFATHLGTIGKDAVQMVRIGVVDSLVADPLNSLPRAIRGTELKFPDMRARIGIYDYLDSLTELRAERLDIAVLGTGADEQVPKDLEAVHLYDEQSGLFCSPAHPCGLNGNSDDILDRLKKSSISAHSFLLNPMGEQLDLLLLDETTDIAQGNVEATVYLALAGTHVGLIPINYANQWVKRNELIAVAPDRYCVVSRIHVVRLKSSHPNPAADEIWRVLSLNAHRQL